MPVSVSILSILCLVIMLLLIPHITRTNRKGLASFKKYYKKAGIPIIQINIQGKDCFMILDTGSAISIVNESFFKKHKNNFPNPQNTHLETHGATEAFSLNSTVYCSLYLKDTALFTVFHISEGMTFFEALEGQLGIEIAGILGSPLFDDYGLILDYDNYKLSRYEVSSK